MTKFLENKAFKRFLSIALTILLVVTLTPHIQPAYGNGEEPATTEDTTFTEEPSDAAAPDAGEPEGEPEEAVVAGEEKESESETPDADKEDEGAASPVTRGTVNAVRYMLAARNISTTTIAENEIVEKTLSYTDGNPHVLEVYGTLKGHIDVSGGSTLTIKGYGTIDGNGAPTVIHVNGGNSKLIIDGERADNEENAKILTITGGNGGSELNDTKYFPNYRGGGGILVQRSYEEGEDKNYGTGATLEFRYGKVDGNKAEAGGGIYIDRGCTFTMEDGIISNNETIASAFKGYVTGYDNKIDVTSAGEGGGIYMAGGSVFKGYKDSDGKIYPTNPKDSGRTEVWEQAAPAEIKKGQIINNKTATTYDWGGGGIFVESKGILKLGNSLIKNNEAQGLGGGIAGCPHASIGIGKIEEGFALYGNTANRAQWPTNKYLDDLTVSYNGKTYQAGDRWAKADDKFTAKKAMDYYCTNVSYVSGYGDRAITWKGRATGSNEFGTVARNITIRNGESLVVPGESLGLTNTKPQTETVTDRSVIITGNKSSTHGGGIGCNGTILIGNVGTGDQYSGLSLTINKEFKNSDGDEISLEGGEFSFELKKGTAVLAEAKNAADGSVTFVVDDAAKVKSLMGNAGATQTNHLTITEVKQDGTPIEYAKDVDVTLTVRHDKQTIKYPNSTVNVTYHTPVITNLKMNGNVYENGAFKLVNTVNLKETVKYEPVGFELQKNLVTTLGDKLSLNERTYTFELSGVDGTKNADNTVKADGKIEATTDKSGKVSFSGIGISSFLQDQPTKYWDGNNTVEVTLKLKEVEPSPLPENQSNVTYDTEEHTVTFTVSPTAKRTSVNNVAGTKTTKVTPHMDARTLKIDGKPIAEKPIVNTLQVKGEWQPTASKHYYGALSDDTSFAFSVKEIAAVDDIANVDLTGGTLVSRGVANDFDKNGVSPVVFDKIEYDKIEHDQGGDTHWYLMSEDSGQDPTVYAFEVEVTKSEDKESLVSTVKNIYFAPTAEETSLTLLQDKEAGAQFYNADTSMDFGLYSYSVNAMSNEPVDQQCLVDPKIIKQLDGRAIKADEFRFKLIQVMGDADGNVDWSDTSGPEISATTNDEFGMVDFDKANNQAAAGMDPCCLLFTAPGTYYYRVIEDADYKKDASVDYSDQVITFTVVVEQDEATGQLTATDMYYGYLDEAGQNVRYKEQYTDYENKVTDPNWVPSIADFPTLNPDWHPTMVNKAKAMDLKVRKTSVLDRTEGLEGATYGLFMVNESEQGDILLGSATSDADGWIYYQNVSLAAGNLYYFKEQAAPAGHTVSEFRSPFFYLEAQTDPETKITTYAMKYTDQKLVPGTAAEPLMALAAAESAEPAVEPLADTGAEATADADTSTGGPEFTDDGTMLFTYDHEGGVYDEATYVEFNKLDTRTHEWVEGAKLSIVEKDTGTVVTSWSSGKAPEKLQKVLNVGVTYVLREDEAPENYQKADDVEFVIDSYGKVSITKGTENGNATLSDSAITLYDTMLDAEEVVPVERETVREIPETGKTVDKLAKTGDMLPLAALGLLALVALAVAAVAARRCRTRKQRVHRR